MSTRSDHCIAFIDDRSIARGPRLAVALAAKRAVDEDPTATLLVFDDTTSRPVELDLRGSVPDVERRYADSPSDEAAEHAAAEPERRRGPGRPKLGVVGREVTLLPRHWEWLGSQPGGASVTLRKLVERARKQSARADAVRHARESAYRFLSAMAGDRPGFEEATRALFADQPDAFATHTESWPNDVREHARRLAALAFHPERADA